MENFKAFLKEHKEKITALFIYYRALPEKGCYF